MNKPLYYLSTPYTNYGQGREQAYKDACAAAGTLMKRGMNIYSPIAHGHGIAEHGGIGFDDNNFWMRESIQKLDECQALIVIQMPGWRESDGVNAEIERAEETRKAICYLSWPMLNVRENEREGDL